MTNNPSNSCIVSPLRECNHATITATNATGSETAAQPTDLLALAQRVLDKNKCNTSCNNPATNRMQSRDEKQLRELKRLITIVSQNYGGDDDLFLNSYIDEVIKTQTHDLGTALECFKNLATQKSPLIKWK